jgi:hypothetical protein
MATSRGHFRRRLNRYEVSSILTQLWRFSEMTVNHLFGFQVVDNKMKGET